MHLQSEIDVTLTYTGTYTVYDLTEDWSIADINALLAGDPEARDALFEAAQDEVFRNSARADANWYIND